MPEPVAFSRSDDRWLLLIAEGAGEPPPEPLDTGALELTPTKAQFDAADSPTFRLLSGEFGGNALVGSTLDDTVALSAIVDATTDDETLVDTLVESLILERKASLAQNVLEDSGNFTTIRQSIDSGGSVRRTDSLLESVTDTIENRDDVRGELKAIALEDPAVQTAVAGMLTEQTRQSIVQAAMESDDPAAGLTELLDGIAPYLANAAGNAVAAAVMRETDASAAIVDAVGQNIVTEQVPVAAIVSVTLKGRNGKTFSPKFHFEKGSVLLVLEPERRFTPGVYTLQLTVTNPLNGESSMLEQDFAWGVLAMNPDKDRYVPGEEAYLTIGVLDDHGDIVCDADVTLAVRSPLGAIQTLSTDDGSIDITGNCGVKEAMNIQPDYETRLALTEAGTYELTLTATTANGTRSQTYGIPVAPQPPFTVRREAATRLWPFAPSPMTITVDFAEPYAGTITDLLPEGFVVVSASGGGIIRSNIQLPDGSGTGSSVRWSGSWARGETAVFGYVYDAPDISPEFYLVGPLTLAPFDLAQGANPFAELRSWQIANDAAKTWDGGGGADTNWDTCTNWNGDTCPTSSDNVIFDGTSDNNVTINVNVDVTGFAINAGYDGTITQNASRTITVNGNFSQASGTFTGGNSTIDINGTYTLSNGTFTATTGTMSVGKEFNADTTFFVVSGGTFNHNNGTVTFDPTYNAGCTNALMTVDVASQLKLYNVIINYSNTDICDGNNQGMTTASGDKVIAENDFTITDGYMFGTWEVYKNLVIGTGADNRNERNFNNYGTLTMSGSSAATYSYTSGDGAPHLRINKSGGAAVTPAGGTTALAATNFTLLAGSFTAPTGTMSIGPAQGSPSNETILAINGGAYNANGGSTVLDAYYNAACQATTFTVDVADGYTLGNVTVNPLVNNCTNITIESASGKKAVTGNFTLSNGTLTGTWHAQGNVTIGSGADGGTASINYSGGNDQTYTDNGTEPTGDVVVNKTASAVRLAQNTSWNTSGQDLILSGGTLNLGGYNLTVNDQLTLGTGGILRLKGGETITGGPDTMYRGSTIWYDDSGTSPRTIKNYTYKNLVIGSTGSTVFKYPVSPMAVQGNLTVSGGTLQTTSAQVLNLSGSLLRTKTGVFTAGTGTVRLTTNGGGTLSGVTFYDLNVNGTGGNWSLGSNTTVSHTLNVSAGRLSQGNKTLTLNGGSSTGFRQGGGTFSGGSATIDLNATFTMTGGTFTATSGEMTQDANFGTTVFQVGAGTTFNHNNGTVTFDSPIGGCCTTNTIDVNGDLTMYNVNMSYVNDGLALNDWGTLAVASGDRIRVEGNFSHNGGVLSGLWEIQGNLTVSDADGAGDGILTMTGSVSRTYAYTGSGRAPVLKINKSGGATVTPLGGTTNLNVSGLQVLAGSFTAPSGTLGIGGSLSTATIFQAAAGTTFAHNNGTVQFSPYSGSCCSTYTIDLPTSLTLYNVSLINSGLNNFSGLTVASGDRLIMAGNFTNDFDGEGGALSGAWEAQGNVTIGANATGGNASITFSGGSNQTYTDTAGGTEPTGTVTVNKTGGAITLAQNTNWGASGQDVHLSGGTLGLGGFNLTVADQLIFGTGGALQLIGTESITEGTRVMYIGSTVRFIGDRDGAADTYTVTTEFPTVGNLELSTTDADIFQPGSTLTLNNDLTVSGSGIFSLNGQNLTASAVNTTVNNSNIIRLQGGETASNFTMDSDSGTGEYVGTSAYSSLALGNAYYNLKFNGAGGAWTLNNPLTVNGNLTLINGALDVSSSDHAVAVGGSWTDTTSGDQFNPRSGTVTFFGKNTLTSRINANEAFHSAVINTSFGLGGHWKLDETSTGGSNSVRDASGNSFYGTPAGASGTNNKPQPSTDVPSGLVFADPYSLDFDGTDDRVELGTGTPSLDNLSAFTVSAWIKPDVSNDVHKIFSKDSACCANSAANGWYFSIFDNSSFWDRGLAFSVDYNGASDLERISNGVLTLGTWQHVAATWNGSSDDAGVRLYVNGTEVGSYTTSTDGAGSRVNDSTTALTIGGNGGLNSNWFDGRMDDMRIYGRVLTSSEIAALAGGKDFAYSLSTSLSASGTLKIIAGTLSAGAQNVTAASLNMQGGTMSGSTGNLDINGALTLTGGTLTAPTGTLTVAGNWTKGTSATFTPGTGTVTLDGSSQTLSGSTTFYNLKKQAASTSTLTFRAGSTQTISGTWTATGSVGAVLSLRSSTTGSQWLVNPGGTRTLSYVDVKDSNNANATAITCDNNCVNSGNNTNWIFPWTGTVYTDEGITNIGAGKTVAISVDGGTAMTTTTNANGQFTITRAASGGNVVAFYLDGHAEKAALVTVTDGSTLAGMDLYVNRLIVRHETGANITTAHLAAADNNGDPDLTDFYSVAGSALTVFTGKELTVWTGDTFRPGGIVAVDDVDVNGTLSLSGNSLNVGGSFESVGGTFSQTGTTTFDSTSNETIYLGNNAFRNVTLNSASGRWRLTDRLSVSGALAVFAGTLDVNGQSIANRGGTFNNRDRMYLKGNETFTNFTNDPDSGTTLLYGTGSYSGIAGLTSFYHMTLSGAGTWTLNAPVTVNGNLGFSGSVLDVSAGNHGLTVGGNWSDRISGDQFNPRAGTVTFRGGGVINANESFYGLTVNVPNPASNLAGYWKFDETSGIFAADASANGFTGSGAGAGGSNGSGPAVSTDVPPTLFTNARSRNFDGTDDFIDIGNKPGLYFSGAFSVSAWVKTAANGSRQTIFSDYTTNGFTATVNLDITSAGLARFIWENPSGTFPAATSSGAVSAGTWHHIASVWDGTTRKIYVDGKLDGTNATSQARTDNSGSAAVGRSGSFPANYIGGAVDDVRVYGTALTQGQILAMANGSSPGTYVLGNALDINGNLTLSGGTLDVSASNWPITLSGSWLQRNSGTLAGSGTVTLDGRNQTLSGSTAFYNLTKIVTSTETLLFGAGTTQTVRGTWTAQGATSNLLSLRSSLTNSQWRIDPAGTRTLSFIDIRDSNNINASTVLCANDCTNSGNNSNWAFPITVTVYSNSGTTLMGAGKTVAIAVNGGTKTVADTNGSSVASFTTVGLSPGDVVTMWLDDETEDAVTVTVTNATTLGFDLYRDYLIVEHEHGSSITNAHLNTANNVADGDVDAIYTMSGSALTVQDGKTLLVKEGSTYAPGGTVSVDNIDINGVFTMGANNVTVRGSWDATHGTFTGTNTVTFTANSAETITSSGSTFYNTVFAIGGTSAQWVTTDAFETTGTQTVQNPNGSTDTVPPTISSVDTSLISSSGALVTWVTNESATSKVVYGSTSGSLTSSIARSALNLNHALVLGGLNASTAYFYRVVSTDLAGNTSTGSQVSFTTIAGAAASSSTESATSGGGGGGGGSRGDKTKPTLRDVLVTSKESTSAVIEWETNEKANSLVRYGVESADEHGTFEPLTLAGSTTHKIILEHLLPQTTYRFVALSVDEGGNTGASDEMTFFTGSGMDLLNGRSIESITTPEEAKKVLEEELARALAIVERLAAKVSTSDLRLALSTHVSSLQDLADFLPSPILSGSPSVVVTDTTATISWATDEEANSLVSFASENDFVNGQYAQTSGDSEERDFQHNVTLIGLMPGTRYHYQVQSITALGTKAVSPDFVFTTSQTVAEVVGYTADVISPESARFRWTSTVPTTTVVDFTPYRNGSLVPDLTQTKALTDFSMAHELVIDDFDPGTYYEVELWGKNSAGTVVSKTISRFTTSTNDLPPEIGSVQTSTALVPGKESRVQAVITWGTNENTAGRIYFQKGVKAEGDLLDQTSIASTGYAKHHVILMPNLEPGTVYSFQIEAIDGANNPAQSRVFTLLTPREQESIFQVILHQMEDTFGWVGNMRGQ